ncbi:MAG: HAMP domain-containing histidine kinase [Epsilonproteobacteria bacterium]|nr:HAMP domain-containing histidine kinase [Campylobacterota bacterium]OIO17930.1 MAG: histidine kinase [Helicobacteraceae bacterium CG1_02_36_14]PIP09336.1 MAG: histidine kinase [Sulfurimonas sp. CG23_combo_of_CG06-09_8_20_14_all_36_33]PIS24389.1 MAG: sensor histidine kinase [Sulfurimonas sp. CG08_land_8_20_14_0_20_36_33]PIU34474.1 MAG: sensor histidine kinase [Sulfurimonas sp. CG07_land_8_20_14_0_80_36_56]PIV03105.1 MAG: sensor histidine kinase [Sulfurimonas sp. CG03_land_8_20_14_0_80_36_25]
MRKQETEDLINDVVKLSRNSANGIDKKIDKLIALYRTEQKQYERSLKQNTFLLKQWDKQNILTSKTNKKKDLMLEQQAKMAAMGEMIDAVAHQWKQPLNSISMMSDMLSHDFSNGLVDGEYIEEMTTTIHTQIEYMISTLNEFRTFFRPSKDKQLFSILACIESVQILLKDELISQNVTLHVDIDEALMIEGIANEFKHLFINFISNSVDAFNEKQTKDRTINIKAYEENDKVYIEFYDNAGGIPEPVIKSIFKPNVTTKKEGKGTGIGLYMSSQIVQKHHGSINVHNSDVGAVFTVILE